MFRKNLIILGCFVSLLFAAGNRVVAYFPYWVQYSQFTPEDVRYDFLTDIHYGYLVPSEDGSLNFADETDIPNFEKMVSLAKEKKVNIMVNIGGVGNEDAMKTVATNESACRALIVAAKEFVEKYGLTGVELDWIPKEPEDFEAFKALVDAFTKSGIVTSASVIGSVEAPALYSAEALNKLEYISVVLTDQMNESMEKVVPNSDFVFAQKVLTSYVNAGVKAENVLPVVPFYGKSFYKATGLGSAYEGVGSGNEGILSYNQLMKVFDSPDYKVSFDENTQSEVAVSAIETVVFNGIPSMKSLASFVKKNGLGGIAAYDVSGDHKHPVVSLLVTIGQVLRPDVTYNVKKK